MPMWLLPRSATPALVLRPPSVLSALAFFMCAAPRVAVADPIDTCIAAAEEGQRLRLEGGLTFAREKFLACSHVECPAVLRADCTRWLSELDAVKPAVVDTKQPRSPKSRTYPVAGSVFLDWLDWRANSIVALNL